MRLKTRFQKLLEIKNEYNMNCYLTSLDNNFVVGAKEHLTNRANAEARNYNNLKFWFQLKLKEIQHDDR